MKKTCTFFLFTLSIVCSFGQTSYFNEWFANDPDRPFVKLLVSEDAIYEVTASELLAAGHDLSQAQPDSIQMYYRGEEIPLTVERDGMGRFASLTFYGRRNDGAVEAQMYRNPISGTPEPSQQPNPNFSLYNDTSAYFLTWGSAVGKRYTTALDINYSLYTPETSYPFESVWEPHPDSSIQSNQRAIAIPGGGGAYDSFYQLNSSFGPGEGYVSEKEVSVGNPFLTSFLQTPDPLTAMQDVRFQLRIFHRSHTEHHTRVTLGNGPIPVVLDTMINYNSIAVKTYTRTLQTQLTAQTYLRFEALKNPTDNNHLTSIRIRYERLPDLANQAKTQISEWPRNATTYFRFANALGQNKVWAYDPANEIRYEGRVSGGDAHIVLSGRFYGKTVEVVTDQGFKKPQITNVTRLSNLCDPDSGAQFIIIAHPALAASATLYAKYRDTTAAGYESLSAKVIYTDEIYEEFSYGAPTPQAIQQFLNCALDNWTVKPKYIFLWGKGNVWMRGFDSLPIVPSYGFPANDVRYTTPWDEDLTAQIAIGRLNIVENRDGYAYLDKVEKFEQLGNEPWRKKGVFLGGGATVGEQNAILNSMKRITACFEDSSLMGGRSFSFQKGVDTVSFYQDSINNGVGLIYVFGHSSSNINDVNLKEAADYQHVGIYPFVIMLGSNAGDFTGNETFGDRWVKEPNRGAIAYFSNSSAGYLIPLRDYSRIFFCQEFGPKPNRPLGEIIRHTYQKMIDSLIGVQYVNHARQMNLQGDPALVICPSGINLGINPPPPLGVEIYPNPVGDKLTISSDYDRIEAVSLLNLYGQVILKQADLFQHKVQLDVSSLASGHYFLQYRTANGVGVAKIVVK